MLVKISQGGHVIIPSFLLEAFGLGPDDELELEQTEDGFTLKLTEGQIKPTPNPDESGQLKGPPFKARAGMPPLDMGLFREAVYDKAKYLELYRAKYGDAGYDPIKSRD